MNKYGLRLKELREKNGYTQETLAEKLGTSRSRIANYEQGVRQPDFKMQEMIADLFGVSIDYLFGREERKDWNVFIDDVANGRVDPNEIENAIEMYALYKNSTQKVQGMVDFLLFDETLSEESQQDS